tara:strand:+ start:6636 stop:7676 length:1041 start_codon:yes stop_codon:yes gene_type:complete
MPLKFEITPISISSNLQKAEYLYNRDFGLSAVYIVPKQTSHKNLGIHIDLVAIPDALELQHHAVEKAKKMCAKNALAGIEYGAGVFVITSKFMYGSSVGPAQYMNFFKFIQTYLNSHEDNFYCLSDGVVDILKDEDRKGLKKITQGVNKFLDISRDKLNECFYDTLVGCYKVLEDHYYDGSPTNYAVYGTPAQTLRLTASMKPRKPDPDSPIALLLQGVSSYGSIAHLEKHKIVICNNDDYWQPGIEADMAKEFESKGILYVPAELVKIAYNIMIEGVINVARNEDESKEMAMWLMERTNTLLEHTKNYKMSLYDICREIGYAQMENRSNRFKLHQVGVGRNKSRV